MRKVKVIFDCNTWISFAMDGRLKRLADFLNDPNLEIYACPQLLDEFQDVSQRPKLQKYLKTHLVEKANRSIENVVLPFPEMARTPISRDPKDDYLIHFAIEYNLNFIVTGDKDLLVLKYYSNIRICTFTEFVSFLEEQELN